MSSYINCYLIHYKDGQLAIKFNMPAVELIQIDADVYTVTPGTPIGYVETWIEQGYPNTYSIRKVPK